MVSKCFAHRLLGNSLEPIKAVLAVEINVKIANGSVIRMPFEKFDRENFTCHDLMVRLETQACTYLSSL
jgi:hypothetical protein